MIRIFASLLFLALPGLAQTEFEVASVKTYIPPPPVEGRGTLTSTPLRGGPGTGDPVQIRWDVVNMRSLLTNAYTLNTFQISGPEWIDSERYSIVAKVAPGATKEQVLVMWQNLLASRFGLKAHRETREVNAYELTVAKGGPKLTESAPPKPIAPPQGQDSKQVTVRFSRDSDGCSVYPDGRRGMSTSSGPGHYKVCAGGMTLEALGNMLSPHLSRPLLDKTGLTGKYDLFLDFDPEDAPSSGDDRAPSLAANFLRLGLKLEAKKSPVDLLIIEKLDKQPTAN